MKLPVLSYLNYCTMAFLFFPVIVPLWKEWMDNPDYSHGFFIIPISLYLSWKQRHKLVPPPKETNFLLLVAFSICLVLFALFYVGDIAFLTRYFMIFVFATFLLLHLGYVNFAALIFPVVYLIFMVPLPASIILPLSLPLRLFASQVSTFIAQLAGVPVFRTGNILHLPGGILEVAPACSGLRSLVSLLALSALVSYLSQKEKWKGIICFLSAIPVAIIANVLRVTSSILLYQYVGHSTAEGLLHESWGLVVFLLSISMLVIINLLVKKI